MNKEKTLIITLDTAKEWYNKGGELKELALRCFNESELIEQFPKTWEDCCKILNKGECISSYSDIMNVTLDYPQSCYRNSIPIGIGNSLLALCQLLICREVYRNGWKPDWTDDNYKYSIYNSENIVRTETSKSTSFPLSFQSAEIRDKFLNNFKDLLEQAKELI